MSLYNSNGQINIKSVAGTTFTGIQSTDGSYNGVVASTTTPKGLYHPCGAFNIRVKGGSDIGIQAPDGSLYVSDNGDGTYSPITPSGQGLNLSSFLVYDNFLGSVVSPTAHTPNKGSAWQITGGAAANMIAGGGFLTQNLDTTPGAAGYAVQALAQVPRKVVGEWIISSGAVDYVPTMAVANNISLAPMIHGQGTPTSFYIRSVTAGPTFIVPAWSVLTAPYAIANNTKYRTELHYDGNKMAAMVLKDASGNVLLKELTYDPQFPSYSGNYCFWETFNDRLKYTLATAEATSDYAFPTITPVKEAFFTSGTDGFAAGPFGGSCTQSSGQLVINTTGSFGTGAAFPMGVPVVAGDKLWYSMDVPAKSAGAFIVAPVNSGGAIGDIVPVTVDASNRAQFAVNITISEPSPSFLVGSDGTGTSITIDNFLLLKNPPTTP